MNTNPNHNLDLNLNHKLTLKQQSILEVLSNIDNKDMTLQNKCKKAGITTQYFYELMKKPFFVKSLQFRGLTSVMSQVPLIAQRMSRDALAGKYMQQKTSLEMSGLLSPDKPIINILINNQAKPDADLDRLIIDKIVDSQPELPQDVVDATIHDKVDNGE